MKEGTYRRTNHLAYTWLALSVGFVGTVFYLIATTSDLPREAVLSTALTVAFAPAAILLLELALWVAAGFPRRRVLAAQASRHDLYAANPEAAGSRTLLEPAKRRIQAASLGGPEGRRPYPPQDKTIEEEEEEG